MNLKFDLPSWTYNLIQNGYHLKWEVRFNSINGLVKIERHLVVHDLFRGTFFVDFIFIIRLYLSVTRPVQDPLAVLPLDNRLYMSPNSLLKFFISLYPSTSLILFFIFLSIFSFVHLMFIYFNVIKSINQSSNYQLGRGEICVANLKARLQMVRVWTGF